MPFNPEDPQTTEAAAVAVLYWTHIALTSWAEALVRKDRTLDRWAIDFSDPRTTASRLRDYGVQFEPAGWLGRGLETAERQVWSRGLKFAIDMRLVQTVARNSRVTHLRPTPRGIFRWWRWLKNDDAMRRLDELKVAFETAEWARPLKVYLDPLDRIRTKLSLPQPI